MMKDTMTGRERIKAVLEGREVDRFPVWLKMTNPTWQLPQPEPYRSMNDLDLLKAAGCDLIADCHCAGFNGKNPHVEKVIDETEERISILHKTPDGDLTEIHGIDPTNGSRHPLKYPVETVDDLRRVRWLYTDNEYSVTEEGKAKIIARQTYLESQDCISESNIGDAPLMMFIEYLAGPANTVYLMMDELDLFEETLEIMHQDRMKELRARLPHEKADTFWLTENTSTTLINPHMFETYCMPHLRDHAHLIWEYGIYPVHHMCGALNALLEMIDRLPAAANEAFTTRPLGDCSLTEGRKRMPSKTLIGGTNATLWLKSPEEIAEAVRQDLADCPDRKKIFLTSAGVLPPPVDFAKAKRTVSLLKTL